MSELQVSLTRLAHFTSSAGKKNTKKTNKFSIPTTTTTKSLSNNNNNNSDTSNLDQTKQERPDSSA